MIRLLLATAAVVVSHGSASAHSAFPGVGDFYNGVVHPLLDPAQLLPAVAAGLVIGQHVPSSSRLALPAFGLAIGLGLVASSVAFPLFSAQASLIATLVAGLLVAVSFDIGGLGSAVVAAVLGLAIGTTAGRESAADGLPWTAFAGTAVGAIVLVILVAGLGAVLTRPWQKIGFRVLGSWLAASAILVLALSFAIPA